MYTYYATKKIAICYNFKKLIYKIILYSKINLTNIMCDTESFENPIHPVISTNLEMDETSCKKSRKGRGKGKGKPDNITEDFNIHPCKPEPNPKQKAEPKQKPSLIKFYDENTSLFEISTDEVGRGPLFGRVYAAAVILPKDDSFQHFMMKDSKKFTSDKKIQEASDYIKNNAIAWSIHFEDEKTIDNINILQASQQAMHKCIREIMQKMTKKCEENDEMKPQFKILVDGNYFNPVVLFNKQTQKLEPVDHICIQGGDNKYSSIAAASILAKVERDDYIKELCIQYPYLSERYSIHSNKGYGAKVHIDGIKQHGITEWHRKTFGICSTF